MVKTAGVEPFEVYVVAVPRVRRPDKSVTKDQPLTHFHLSCSAWHQALLLVSTMSLSRPIG